MPEIVYEKRWVTPATAAEYLRTQVPNRIISPVAVSKYARDLAAGEWQDNGITLKLNVSGQMLDGQHRCAAVIEAEKVVEADRLKSLDDPTRVGYKDFEGVYLTFALNVPEEARATMDIGRKRSIADFMAVYGVERANRITPVVTWHLAWTKGNLISANGRGAFQGSQQEIIAHWAADETAFATTTQRGRDLTQQKLGPTTPFGVAYHVLRKLVGDELVDTFWDKLVDGADLNKGNPILILRNQLARERFPRHIQLQLVFRAWNAWIDGREMERGFYFKKTPTNSHFELPRRPEDKRNPSPVLKDSDPAAEVG